MHYYMIVSLLRMLQLIWLMVYPFCRYCNSDDCGHVGFTIYLDELHGPGETIESIDAEEQ